MTRPNPHRPHPNPVQRFLDGGHFQFHGLSPRSLHKPSGRVLSLILPLIITGLGVVSLTVAKSIGDPRPSLHSSTEDTFAYTVRRELYRK